MVYNLGLQIKIHAWQVARKNVSVYELSRQLTDAKKEFVWLNEIDRSAMERALFNLDIAFKKFFAGGGGYPKFKNKKGVQSYSNYHGQGVLINGSKIRIPKFSEGIRFVKTRDIGGIIKTFTISKTTTGKYFISVIAEDNIATPEKITGNNHIGIDLGLSHFAITSDGIKIENPRHLRNSIQRIKVLQRRLRNKKNGSNNKKKAYEHIAILHEKISNQRKDFLHKLSTQLVNNHDTLCFESLNVSGMLKNRKLSLSISDAGWGMFVGFCKYKSEWYGKNIVQMPAFQASTKICSVCASVNGTLNLSDRKWGCANCGAMHDRDVNAAINIRNYCMEKSGQVLSGEPVEMSTLVGSMKQEVIVNGNDTISLNTKK